MPVQFIVSLVSKNIGRIANPCLLPCSVANASRSFDVKIAHASATTRKTLITIGLQYIVTTIHSRLFIYIFRNTTLGRFGVMT